MKIANPILISYGTRPEYIKIKSLIDIFEDNDVLFKILYTGQHQDIVDYNFDYSININAGLNRLDSITKSVMNTIPTIQKIEKNKITHVIVQGDTTSAMAVALSAFHNKIKVIHLEAGLRTYDNKNPYPEEMNRRLISQLADIHLCPTDNAKYNLQDEGIKNNIHVVGNTVIDNLLPYKPKCEYTNKILVTLHRRENHHWMDKWFIEINKLAKKYAEYDFILPIHPNINVKKHKHLLPDVNIIDPLPYNEMLNLLIKVKLIITDSGGLQEEASFFNKKCLVCRVVTERPEALNKSTFLIKSPNDLKGEFEEHHNYFEINYDCPFGDGSSSKKIMKILNDSK